MAYHAGFNMGYNCAESVNFALDDWIPFGQKSLRCKCDSERATINMNSFMYAYEMKKYGQAITALPPDEELAPLEEKGPKKQKKRSMKAVSTPIATTTTTTAKSTASSSKEKKANPKRQKRKAEEITQSTGTQTNGKELRQRKTNGTSVVKVAASVPAAVKPPPVEQQQTQTSDLPGVAGIATRRKRAKLTETSNE